MNHCWDKQNTLLPNPAGLETQGMKERNQSRAGQSICLCLQHFWPLDMCLMSLILYKVIPCYPVFATPITYAWNPVIPSGFSSYSKMKTTQREKSCWQGEVKTAKPWDDLCYAKLNISYLKLGTLHHYLYLLLYCYTGRYTRRERDVCLSLVTSSSLERSDSKSQRSWSLWILLEGMEAHRREPVQNSLTTRHL